VQRRVPQQGLKIAPEPQENQLPGSAPSRAPCRCVRGAHCPGFGAASPQQPASPSPRGWNPPRAGPGSRAPGSHAPPRENPRCRGAGGARAGQGGARGPPTHRALHRGWEPARTSQRVHGLGLCFRAAAGGFAKRGTGNRPSPLFLFISRKTETPSPPQLHKK